MEADFALARDGYALGLRVGGGTRRGTMSSLGFWGNVIGGFVITVVTIPILIIVLLLMLPARLMLAIKRTVVRPERTR